MDKEMRDEMKEQLAKQIAALPALQALSEIYEGSPESLQEIADLAEELNS